MTDIHVVTSCSAKGWGQYGNQCAASFVQFWPQSIQLHVVSEDPVEALPGIPYQAYYWPLSGFDVGVDNFLAKNANTMWVHGRGDSPRPPGIAPRWRDNSGYNFRFDAYKFSKKVFAIALVAEQLRAGRLLWLDADTKTFAPVPADLPDRVLPTAYALSCLARVGYHSECGFVGYNLESTGALPFIRAFAALYIQETVFELAEWHDSWVFDWLRNKMLTSTYAIPHKSTGHPFINSELGKYMDHLKGRRKDKGRSQRVEQIIHKRVPYWQES